MLYLNKIGIVGMHMKKVYSLLIIFAIACLSVGYATVSSVDLTISGNIAYVLPEKLLITDATVPSGSTVVTFYDTMVNPIINLSNNNLSSEVSMSVTLYNNADNEYAFEGVTYEPGFYDNNNIDYYLSGISVGDILGENQSKTFNIIFKYSDSYKLSASAPYTNSLNAFLKINFSLTTGYAVTYTGISDASSLPDFVPLGSSFSANLGSSQYSITSITMGGVQLSSSNFTFIDNVINISNVTGDIQVNVKEIPETVNYVFSSENPEEVKTITATQVTNLFTNGGFTATTGYQTAKSISLVVPYNNTSKKNYAVTCTLTVDGVTVDTKSYTIATNSGTMTIDFTGLNIAPGSTVQIAFAQSGNYQGNQQVSFTTETITFGFN